jgi:uncharacterized protein
MSEKGIWYRKMKKFDFRNIRLRKVTVDELDERLLLINVYITQALTLLLALIIIFFQGRSLLEIMAWPAGSVIWLWGAGLAAAVLLMDMLISRWVPDDIADDGGINRMLFRLRPLWHIILLSFVVSVCEELLFRGAIQHAWGAYWTSILFAAIHVRYLRHWVLTGIVFSSSYGLGWIYDQTGSLWAPIFAHFLIDVIMGCIIRFRREEHEDEQPQSGES